MNDFVVNANGTVREAGADADATSSLRNACERSLYVLCKAVLGMSAFTTHLHLPLCQWLQSAPPRKRILLTPRGTFKTSMARGLGIFAVIQKPYSNPFFPGREGRNLRLLYAAENEKRAISRVGWIRRQFTNNQLFRALWPECTWETTADSEIWTLSRFALPRSEDYPEATFEAAGVDSGTTGGHYDIIIKDDLIGQRCLKQPELVKAAIDWWTTSHSLFDDESRDFDFVFGTRWRAEDIYSWIFENELDYDVRIYAASKRPFDLPPSGHPHTELLFPERLDRLVLAEMKRKYGQLYYLNYENEPYEGGNTAFTMALCGHFLREGDTIRFDEEEATRKVLAVIEQNDVVPKQQTKPLPFYRMTPDERAIAWQGMIERWRLNRIARIERT